MQPVFLAPQASIGCPAWPDRCPTTVIDAFEAVAYRWPDRIALVEDAAEVTYRDLEAQSQAVAGRLRAAGVEPGDRVALQVGRSSATIILILGILMAGAAFVPLDPAHPEARLRSILDDCEPALVVFETGPAVAFLAGRRTVRLTELLDDAALPAPDYGRGGDPQASDPAYIMYTSGSTGQPKGVVVPHRAIVRLVRGQSYAPFGPDETFLHLAPLAFDACTFEIWGALLNGGRLAILAEAQPSLDAIASAVERHGVTVAWFTAGLFHLLVEHGLGRFGSLRCLLAGGDVLSAPHVRQAQAALPQCQVVNGYGPTENATFTCCYPVPRGDWTDASVPIGPAIAHGEVFILDGDLRQVPDGETGQIAAAGDGLALGYLNRPGLTADAFVSHPALGRVYLTGDLGRRRPDGAVVFLGRLDRQVKINGKRIELDEIEHVLRADPELADAVIALEDSDGSKRLRAFVKPKRRWLAALTAAKLRDVQARLRRRLPDYMVPADVVAIDLFPLTPNGKVDRDRLLAGVGRGAFGHATSDTRLPPTMQRLSALWRQVLGRDVADPDANLFDLGCTSLQVMALHARLTGAFGPDIPLMALFQHTTLRELAAFLDRRSVMPERDALPVAAPPTRTDALRRPQVVR